jgi:plasmid stability protein
MRTLEISNLPDELYHQIEKLAQLHGRSISEEAADFLSRGLSQDDEREAKLMEEIRASREALARRDVHITSDQLRADRNWGRD